MTYRLFRCGSRSSDVVEIGRIHSPMTQNVAQLAFWGVRGSTPSPAQDTWRYGGNTPCVELTCPGPTRFILDCGTGLRVLGNRWVEAFGGKSTEAHVLLTHYHWDHVQGIPFFHPFFEAQNSFHFYGFQSKYLGDESVRKAMEEQLADPYFPVHVSVMAAARSFQDVKGGDKWEVNGTRISAASLNHPQGCLGYRLDTAAGSIVYATDNEPGVAEFDQNVRQLAEGADILIYDSQYSPEQLASSRKGWGHSSWLEGVKIAREASVKNLILFHHDPDSSDRTVDGFLSAARREFPATWAASEGMGVTLKDQVADFAFRESRRVPRRRLKLAAIVTGQSESGAAFEEKVIVQDLGLQGAYLSLTNKPRLQSEIRVVIDATEGAEKASSVSLRGTVVHCESSAEKKKNGVGVAFVEETESGSPRD